MDSVSTRSRSSDDADRPANQKACSGGTPNLDACETSADCIVTSAGCCSECEPISRHGLIAIHRDRQDDVLGRCDVACGPCAELQPGQVPLIGNYFAACVDRECTLKDVRETPASECTDDTECRLRSGSGCCERCSGAPIAVSDEQVLVDELDCAPDLPCPPCEPVFEPALSAVCNDGRCAVESSL